MMTSVDARLAHFFKPEVQRAGHDLVKKKSVFLQIGNDTQIDATVRSGASSAKVGFRAESIEDETFSVDCSCPSSKRGKFCKHIWAVLEIAAHEKSDFFESKLMLDKGDFVNARATQAAHIKAVYEHQKERAKEFKRNRKAIEQKESIRSSAFSKALPNEIREAIEYFEKNGFPLTIPVDEATINNAKRVLSRVFHPDKGGTHDEIVELLRHSNALIKFRL